MDRKVNDTAPHVIKRLTVNIAGMKKGQLILVRSVRVIDRCIKMIAFGQSMTISVMRARLAEQYGTETTCPVYTGYHLRTIAEAVFEMRDCGIPFGSVTPIWRVLDAKAPTVSKLRPTQAGTLAQLRKTEKLSI